MPPHEPSSNERFTGLCRLSAVDTMGANCTICQEEGSCLKTKMEKGPSHPCWGDYGMSGHKWRYSRKLGPKLDAKIWGKQTAPESRTCTKCGEIQYLNPYGDD